MPEAVLLVDDDPFITRALERNLRSEEFETVCARSAFEAIAILEAREIAVVVSDDRMPGMTGSELMVLIRERYPATQRIILTGYATLESALDAINRAEVYRFVLKPCSLEELAATIRDAVERYRTFQRVKARLSAVAAEERFIEDTNRISREVIDGLDEADDQES